jgi:hypothetical protein
MDQVSRPLLIALGATVAFLVVWLVALRPGAPPAESAPPASAQATGQAGAGSQTTTAAPAARPATAARPAPVPSAAAPAATASRGAREAAVMRDIRGGRVVVMLVWNPRGADDRATRAAVGGLDRRGGKVAVHVVPVSRVGDLPSITQGVTISQSPTTLVIGKDRRARVIAGLSEPGELSQAVGDALARR